MTDTADDLSMYEQSALDACGGILGQGLAPLPPLPFPQYRPIESGRWKFRMLQLAACPGYFRGPQICSHPVATLMRDGISWMSTTPAEIESQMPHAAVAHGKVVICGLGLGVMAYAVAARRAVKSVVVVERDEEVVRMFHEHSDFAHWPQREKIAIVVEDALAFRCADADFLYADIWPRYRMDEMIPDMQSMHRNTPAPECGYWGQELDMVDWAAAHGTPREGFTLKHVAGFCAATALPLIGAHIPGYAEMCRMAGANPAFKIPAERRLP